MSCYENVILVKFLIAHGADTTCHGPVTMETPLHHAEDGYVVDALVSGGANVDDVNGLGETPLHIAALHNYFGAVRSLLSHGADRSKVEMMGRTPLSYAYDRSSLSAIAILLQ